MSSGKTLHTKQPPLGRMSGSQIQLQTFRDTKIWLYALLQLQQFSFAAQRKKELNNFRHIQIHKHVLCVLRQTEAQVDDRKSCKLLP